MSTKKAPEQLGQLNIRAIPRTTLFRLKMAAAAEQKTLKDLVLDLIDTKLKELEREGKLPKGRV